jgi:hypothetical protein
MAADGGIGVVDRADPEDRFVAAEQVFDLVEKIAVAQHSLEPS